MKQLVLVALAASFAACGGKFHSPSASSSLPSSVPTVAAQSTEPKPPVIPGGNGNVPAAVLEATFTATPNPSSPIGYPYDLKLLATETTGKSAAIIQAVVVKMPNGNTDMGCVPLGVRVAAGATVDIIKEAGYCAPGADRSDPGSKLSATITYSDEAGVSATLTAFALLE